MMMIVVLEIPIKIWSQKKQKNISLVNHSCDSGRNALTLFVNSGGTYVVVTCEWQNSPKAVDVVYIIWFALCGLHDYTLCQELWGYHGNKVTGRG